MERLSRGEPDLIRIAEQGLAQVKAMHDVRYGPYLWRIHAEVLQQSGDLSGAQAWAHRALDADRRYDDPSSPDIIAAQATVDSIERDQAIAKKS
jgi:hypothetical protein